MKIIKYQKKRNGKYQIILDSKTELMLYEETILELNLLAKKDIGNDLFEINKINQKWDVYYVALKALKIKARSVYELKLYLKCKEYPEELITMQIEKLKSQGYLNDKSYAKNYIYTQMAISSKGPYLLEKELLAKKIDKEIIKEELLEFSDEEQIKRINKLVEKKEKQNHTRGGVVLKQKIYQDIKNHGYDISLINQVLDSYSFKNNSSILKKEYEKLKRKYQTKYQGIELERKIKEGLYKKGLAYEEIQ